MDAIPQLDTRGDLARLWGWLKESVQHHAYPGWFDRWPDYEKKVTVLRTFGLVVIPGLLQTEDYARAVLRTRVNTTDDEIEQMVEARIARQSILTKDKPPMIWAVIDEGALRRPVGGKHVMRDQLNRLAEAAKLPNVVIQVVPVSVGSHDGLRGGPFVIAEFADSQTVAYQDAAVEGQIVDRQDGIASLMVLWDTLSSPPTGGLTRTYRGSSKVMDLSRAMWRKASMSTSNGGDCVEVAHGLPGIVAVRDSKDPDGPKLTFPPSGGPRSAG